ncbi:SDR family oxidoreductase [Streptomyces sp. NPDC059262]|uniref:SDR family oxidoreductase n=1 Tax=Streptomyces sp. NPDC059262 TaxID=3346797 RepID=UPI0036A7A425
MTDGVSVDWSLQGKVAIVTGAATGGIGETYARTLATAGAAVVCADIREESAAKVAAALEADGHRAVGVGVDITDPDSVETMTRTAAPTFGGVDVLVNNAALMATVDQGPVLACDYDHWKHVMDVNLNGAYLCSRSAVPYMRERGGGRIVNQTSGGAYPPSTLYGITKLALVGLTTTLARELGPSRITANAIAPGLVESEAGKELVPEGSPFREMIKQVVAMEPFAEPEELSGTLLLLTTPAGRWITGQVVHVDGGWVLRP